MVASLSFSELEIPYIEDEGDGGNNSPVGAPSIMLAD